MTEQTSDLLAHYGALPARRVNVDLGDGSRLGFSIPAGATYEAAARDILAIQRRVAFGHSRRIVDVDGPPRQIRHWPGYLTAVLASYGTMWAHRAWAFSFGRRKAEARIRQVARALNLPAGGGEP